MSLNTCGTPTGTPTRTFRERRLQLSEERAAAIMNLASAELDALQTAMQALADRLANEPTIDGYALMTSVRFLEDSVLGDVYNQHDGRKISKV